MNKQNVSWKLVPVQPTEEMLKAMDECSTEGYDERLYAGHAASVYMAAVDAAPASPQQCYCGDITRLGVVHRADSFCDEKPEQEPVARSDAYDMIDRFLQNNLNSDADYAEYSKALDSIYTTPPQRKPLTDEQISEIVTASTGWNVPQSSHYSLARAIEAAHGITKE